MGGVDAGVVRPPAHHGVYLYRSYIRPVQRRFVRVFEQLRAQGRIILLTSGGTAPFGQRGLVSRMAPKLASPDDHQVRLYAENVADMLLNGLSLPSNEPGPPGER